MALTRCPFSSLLWKGHPVTVRQLKSPKSSPDVLLADLQHCRLPVPLTSDSSSPSPRAVAVATAVGRVWLSAGIQHSALQL